MKAARLLLPAAALITALAAATVLLASRRPAAAPPASDAAMVQGSPGRAPAPGALVVSEFHGDETLLLALSPDHPNDRRPLVRIPHASGAAPRAALAPGGDLVAYTALPPGGRSLDTDGVLWVIALTERRPRRLATGVDVRTTPIWAPDGSRVVSLRVRSDAPGLVTALEEIGVRDGTTRELARADASARLYPVGYAPDGDRFYYLRFDRDGGFLYEVRTRTGGARRVARLTDGAARDFTLSPDGSAMLYLALGGSPARYRAMEVDLATGDVRPVLPEEGRAEDVGVAWRPGTSAQPTTGVITGTAGVTGRVVLGTDEAATLAERSDGFDVPVAWSPDGRFLAVRSFSGASADDPGREAPVLLDAEGGRHPLMGDGTIEFIGWVTHAP